MAFRFTFKCWICNANNEIREINDEKEKIIFIGGSITQGWAVNDNESFPFIIQAKYPYYKVYNYGVGGYGGYQSLLRLEKVIKKKRI